MRMGLDLEMYYVNIYIYNVSVHPTTKFQDSSSAGCETPKTGFLVTRLINDVASTDSKVWIRVDAMFPSVFR